MNNSPNQPINTTTLSNSASVFSGIVEIEKSCIKFLQNELKLKEVKLEDIIPNNDPDKIAAIEDGRDLSTFARENMCTMYYDGLINSRYPSKAQKKISPYNEIAHFRKTINRKIKCTNNVIVNVVDIDYRVMSKEMVLFSIKVDNSGLTLNQITCQNFTIRSVNNYNKKGADKKPIYSDEWIELFADVIKLRNECCKIKKCDEANLSHTLFTGNKLYNYVIAQLPAEIDSEYNDDRLYELANEMRIGTLNDKEDPYYPNEEYKKYLLETHSIASFNNWKGLAINDTTAILMKSTVKPHQYNSWLYSYLEFIYFNAFYINAYLMKMNHKYQSREGNADLEKEYLEFDRTFNFHNISYRFQPQLIYERLRIGMEINDELIQLKEKIQQYSEKHERENEKRINIVLSTLTVLSIFSLANDLSSYIDTFKSCEISNYSNLIGGLFAFVILIAILIYFICNKINKKK